MNLPDQINKRFTIKNVNVYKAESGWFVATTEEGDTITGESIVEPAGTLNVIGSYQTTTRWGKQFKISQIFYDNLLNIVEVLLTSGFVNGIKRSKTKEMINALGERVFEVLDGCVEEPRNSISWDGQERDPMDILMSVKGVGPIVCLQITDSWKARRGIAGVAVLSIRAGLTAKQFRKGMAELGPQGLTDTILLDPYALTNVDGFTWETADAVAALEWEGKRKIPHDSPERAAAALREVIRLNSLQGHTCMNFREAVNNARILAKIKDIEKLIDLETSGMVMVDDMITTNKWYRMEKAAAEHINKLLNAKFKREMNISQINLSEFTDYKLGNEQMSAIDLALRSNISVITGAPGTGKTTAVLITLLNILDKMDISYSLCAPTGKAKTRITEATGREASTLHRLFHLGGDEEEIYPLYTDYLFIDESSMVSMDLLHDLLTAVSPGQRIVFIGDGDQLPPVGPGEPLLQMLEAGVPQVRLKEVHRQALKSGIIVAAHEILAGKQTLTQADDFIVAFDKEDNIPARTVKAINWLMDQKGFKFKEIQVMTPVNKGTCGRNSLNKHLQETFNPGAPTIVSVPFRINDPVIQTINNYDKDVMNGEVGTVVSMEVVQQMGSGDLDIAADNGFIGSDKPAMEVEYPMHNDLIGYKKDDFDQLQLAYAITVHKSQGSQFPAVIVIMPYTHEGFYLRQLPYTAITRAEKICIIISAHGAVGRYIANEKLLRRNSLFSILLQETEHA